MLRSLVSAPVKSVPLSLKKASVNISSRQKTPSLHFPRIQTVRGIATSRTTLDDVIFKPIENDPGRDRLKIEHLADNPGSHYRSKRVGRGIGSGKGKTCGRGHKGQNSRSGSRKPHASFEGGQTPLFKRMRKYGFSNGTFKKEYDYVNLNKIQEWIDRGRIDPNQTITMKTLKDTKCVTHIKEGLKVLARQGPEGLKQPIRLESAREAVEKAGGTVTTMYYNRLGLRYLLYVHLREQQPNCRTERSLTTGDNSPHPSTSS
ncbi:ribosomal protein L15, mitochondrial [Planoprotostelium fungivorum]|nr:ribosomal protein L15, mitochondrial [Planoprotostelium fungivorum]